MYLIIFLVYTNLSKKLAVLKVSLTSHKNYIFRIGLSEFFDLASPILEYTNVRPILILLSLLLSIYMSMVSYDHNWIIWRINIKHSYNRSLLEMFYKSNISWIFVYISWFIGYIIFCTLKWTCYWLSFRIVSDYRDIVFIFSSHISCFLSIELNHICT